MKILPFPTPIQSPHFPGLNPLLDRIDELTAQVKSLEFENGQLKTKLCKQTKIIEVLKWKHKCRIKTLNKKYKEKIENLATSLRKFKKDSRTTIKNLKSTAKNLERKLKLREHLLFGRKSEKKGSKSYGSEQNRGKGTKAKRGRRKGHEGQKRRDHSHLPSREESYDLTDEQKNCSICGKEKIPLPGVDSSEIIEVEVKAHRRVIKRKKYRPGCACENLPGVIAAPGPSRAIKGATYGHSVWCMVLLGKFLYQLPNNRLLESLRTSGLDIPAGTISCGLRRLQPLFDPVMAAICARNRKEQHWNIDETGWRVFGTGSDKKWWLWAVCGQETVVYLLEPSRASAVPSQHLGQNASGVITADRFSAYKVLDKSDNFTLSWCWAHVRRDFLRIFTFADDSSRWANQWLNSIDLLFHENNLRLCAVDNKADFLSCDQKVRAIVDQINQRMKRQLRQKSIAPERRKALESLKKHWPGLTLFVDRLEIPMTNNRGERLLRLPVMGRKAYYGSSSPWAARLAATMFSIFQTLLLWQINPRLWLMSYLDSCIGGVPPPDINHFLPWEISDSRRQNFSVKPITKELPCAIVGENSRVLI